MTGVYLLATTDAAGVLFRHTTGLAYDTLAVQYASLVYLIQCATGGAPTWHASPCQVAPWTDWVTTAPCLRTVVWVPVDTSRRPAIARFVASTCLSTPSVWPGWSPRLLAGLLDTPLPPPLPRPAAPLSPWEHLAAPAPPPAPKALAGVAEQVEAWVRALDHGVPPVVDLNALLALLELPLRAGSTSAAATLVVVPPGTPRTLSLPEASNVVPLWHPCLDGFSYTDVERLNALLHSPAYFHNELYDEVREVCQKKLGSY